MNRREGAFTLIELLVVIVIIGILATISTTSFNGAMERARLAKAQSMAAQMKTQFIAENIVSKNPLFTGWYAFEDGEVSQSSPFVLDKSDAGYDILYNQSGWATFSQSDDTGTGSGKSLELVGGTLYAGAFSSQTPITNKVTMGF